MAELDVELRRLGAELVWPDTPDLATAVRRRIETPAAPRFRLRTLAIAFAVLAVAAGAVLAVPPARSAILDWLGFGGVEIRRVDELAGVQPEGRLVLGERTNLSEARRRAGHPVLVPAESGVPDSVYLDTASPGRPVALVYGPLARPRLLVLEFQAAPLIEKTLGGETRAERVLVNGEQGVWIEGARHEFLFRTRGGGVRADTQRLAGNTLIWTRGRLTLRLEGDFSKEEALRIARSVHR